MNIVFFGSSDFAVPSLQAISKSNDRISAVVTAPDQKKGRGLKVSRPPIKEAAASNNIPILQPEDIRGEEFINRLKELKADLFIVAAYGRILTKEILGTPELFSVNLHASLLPKYRGPAPINWALINGERSTGVSIIRMDEFIDTGDIILQEELAIKEDDDALTLAEKLSKRGAGLLVETLRLIKEGKAEFKKQYENASSLAPRLKKATGKLNWQMSAEELHNRVRGLIPWPCAFTNLGQKMFKILKSRVVADNYGDLEPGTIVALSEEDEIVVQTGGGKLGLLEVQLEGGKRMSSADFIRGHKLKIGLKLGVVI